MTKQQIEEKYHVKCEKTKSLYTKDCDFWAVKDGQTNEEIERCATLSDVIKTLDIIRTT